MFGKISNVAIKGIVTTVPQYCENNEIYVDSLGEKRVKKQARMTGIQNRHIDKDGQSVADLCITSARKLIDQLNWGKDDIKVLVLVTQYPSLMLPSTAFVVQKHLNISNDCLVFDVNLGCSGYASGIHIVSSLLAVYGKGAKGILLAGETQRSAFFDQEKNYDEIADEMLFGSAGTATAIEIAENNSDIYFSEISEGDKYNAIYREFGGNNKMDGEAVFEYAINNVTDYVTNFVSEVNAVFPNTIDYFVFHQTQKFMLSNIANICNIDEEKMLLSLEKYGNTSSASIPLTICLHKEKILSQSMTNLMICGFGVGLACAMMQLSICDDIYLELLESDQKYQIL